jgi:hypothetical protein
MFLSKEPENAGDLKILISKFSNSKSELRRKDMQKRIDYYYDKQLSYLDDNLKKQFKKPDNLKLQKEFDNVTSLIIDELAVIYAQEPIRKIINGTDKDQELYERIITEGKLNLILAEANKMSKLCKTVLIRVVWRNDKIQFDIITPNIFEVIQDQNDPTTAIGFVYASIIDITNQNYLNKDDTFIDRDPFDNTNIIYFYWSDKKNIIFKKLSRGDIQIQEVVTNIDNVNPYQKLPFVTIHDGIPISDYFIEGGDDLINTNEIINIKLTEANFLTKMQSFSIPVRKGADNAGSTITLDPSMIIDIPADSDVHKGQDFKFVSPEAKLREIEESIDRKKRNLAIKYKLDPDLLIQSADKASAQSMQLRSLQKAILITQDRPFYRNYEQQLFNIIRIVHNYHSAEKISDKAELKVDFIESETPMTINERDQHNLLLFNNGIISKARWMMDENPDIQSEDEANQLLIEIQKKNSDILSQYNPADGMDLSDPSSDSGQDKKTSKQ